MISSVVVSYQVRPEAVAEHVRLIEAVFFGNCVQGHMEGQDMVRGEIALRPFGIHGVPVIQFTPAAPEVEPEVEPAAPSGVEAA